MKLADRSIFIYSVYPLETLQYCYIALNVKKEVWSIAILRVVFEAEASGRSKAGGLPHLSLSPFPPLPLSIPLSFQTNQWEGMSDTVRGKFPGFPLQIPPWLYYY